MTYEWDENKRISNISKHGLDFLDAPVVFDDEYAIEIYDVRYSDDRWLLIGRLYSTVVVIAYVETFLGSTRIISMRVATNNEQDRYAQEVASRIYGANRAKDDEGE